jgi:uracil-DNA glycosylase family 4
MSMPPSDDARRARLLDALGVAVWLPRKPVPETPSIEPQAAFGCAVDMLDWEPLEAAVAACQACELHRGRTQTVFGTGNRAARWMVIGEAPGAEEDKRGEPFVGRAGQLLNSMLQAVGLPREAVFIANILKCRPPANRDPEATEVASCEAFLARQIALVEPRLILAVGRIAAQNLLKVQTPLARLRGQAHRYGPRQIPLVVTYHPAYLLRSPGEKRRAWEDLQFAAQLEPPLPTSGA